MRRVVIIGGSGFVGRRLAPALASAGYDVISASRRNSTDRTIALDIGDPRAVRRFFRSMPPADAVVHLAAIAHRRWRARPSDYDRVNHWGLRHVLDAALEAGVRQFLFFSSSLVYQQTDSLGPIGEDAKRAPADPYARSKAAAEDACFEAIERGARVVVLRFPAIYGIEFLRGLRMRAYLPFTCARLFLRMIGAEPEYSFCAVENAVEAVLFSLRAGIHPGPYNVADAQPYLQQELRQVLGRLDGSRPTVSVPVHAAALFVRLAKAVLPDAAGAGLEVNFLKLFVGSRLDTSRMERAGFSPKWQLQDLLSKRALVPAGFHSPGAWLEAAEGRGPRARKTTP